MIIYKRQLIAIIISLIIIYSMISIKIPHYIIMGAFTYLCLILSFSQILITKETSLFIKHNSHKIFLFLPLFILSFEITVFRLSFKYIFIGIIIGIFLILIYYKSFKDYLKNNNPIYNIKIDKKDFNYNLFHVITTVIGEEIYFRLYLLSMLEIFYFKGIILISILFTYLHYINKTSHREYNFKNYIQHFIVSLILSLSFVITNNLMICIIAHLIFNIPHLISRYKRTKIKQEEVIFDDYE